MDRLLAPTRPFNTILRPGDGKVPERIAYILCTGSRDEHGRQPALLAVLLHVLDQAEPAGHGRPAARRRDGPLHGHPGPGQALRRVLREAKSMGANYVKGRVAKITEKPDGNLILRYEDIENGGELVEAEYDMVVLAVGVQPNSDARRSSPTGDLELDEFHYVAETDEDLEPGPARASPACSSPGRRRAPRTSPTRSSTPAPRSPRSRPTSRSRASRRWRCRHERQAARVRTGGDGAKTVRGSGESSRGRPGTRGAHSDVRELAPGGANEGGARAPGASASTSATAAATSATTSTSRPSSTRVKDEPGVVVAKTTDVRLLRRGPAEMEADIEDAEPRRPRRRLVLAQAPRRNVPRRRASGPA